MSNPIPANPPMTLHFGAALAIEGRTLLIGMPEYGGSINAPPNAAGRVAVFSLNKDNQWERSGTIDPDVPTPSGGFGNRVALAERFALVGSNNEVFVFTRKKNATWRQIAKLTPAPGEHYDGGLAVSGDSLLLGVSVDDLPGRVDVFDVTPHGRVHRVQRLQAFPTEEGDLFGQALAADRGTLVVGAPGADEGLGAAFVYQQTGRKWVLSRRLVAADQDPATALGPVSFGAAVAISKGLIAVGAPGADRSPQPGQCAFVPSGAAYIFAQRGMRWVQAQKVGLPNLCAFDFGTTVAISRNFLSVGAPSAFPFVFEGAHVYRRTDGEYVRQYEVFGSEVSVPQLALEGSHLVAGFPRDRFFSTGFALAYDLAAAP